MFAPHSITPPNYILHACSAERCQSWRQYPKINPRTQLFSIGQLHSMRWLAEAASAQVFIHVRGFGENRGQFLIACPPSFRMKKTWL